MYKILLSNDDGYDAPGLKVLFETLKEHAELFVVAPQINNSGAGCSITTNQPMFETENDNGFISVNGRPADCVYLGIHKLAPWKPDLVISGINLGANMGEDLLYSGTVGAALEAKGLDFPSIAISAAAFHQPGSKNHMEPNYKTAALVVLDLIKHYDLGSIDPSLVLNVNTPNIDYSDELEYRITSVGSWGQEIHRVLGKNRMEGLHIGLPIEKIMRKIILIAISEHLSIKKFQYLRLGLFLLLVVITKILDLTRNEHKQRFIGRSGYDFFENKAKTHRKINRERNFGC